MAALLDPSGAMGWLPIAAALAAVGAILVLPARITSRVIPGHDRRRNVAARQGFPGAGAMAGRALQRCVRVVRAMSGRSRGAVGPGGADDLLDGLDLLAAALRAGLPPTSAVHVVERSGLAMGSVLTRLSAGAGTPDAGPVTSARSARELAVVEQAWRLSELTGAPLADAVETAAQLLREQDRLRRATEVALAGPRATMRLLTALPLAGPVVAAVFGVSPSQLYAGSPLALASCVIGLGLLSIGRLWCARLIAAVDPLSDAGGGR